MNKIIGFVTSGLTFSGDTINKSALGGSESAMIYMAEELAKLDNTVYVYCECNAPGVYNKVIYSSNRDFTEGKYPPLDVCVVSRYFDFFQKQINSKYNVFWTHDVPQESIEHPMWQTDIIFCLSRYQKFLYQHDFPIKHLLHVTRNGYDAALVASIQKESHHKRENNYIYASSVDRGLKFLLESIWPKVLERAPLSQLHLAGYKTANLDSQDQTIRDYFAWFYHEIDALIAESKNVINHGHLNKREYYTLLGSCSQMLYPTDFEEISCINAIEAQAMGCTVISTKKYALVETVKTATLVSAPYGTNEYIEEFLHKMNNGATVKIPEYAWNIIAYEWNLHFNAALAVDIQAIL